MFPPDDSPWGFFLHLENTMTENLSSEIRGIGVMTGTSLDGIDLVCCRFQLADGAYSFELEKAETIALDSSWQARIQHLPDQSAEVFAKTHIYFGHYLGQQIQGFINTLEQAPDFVASHGQTIFHQPARSFTFQLGDGETIASYLSCPLICNFRNKDVALKGEGAPLVPLGEQYLFPDHSLFLNLGGICNLSWQQQAFDVTACNLILNGVYQHHYGGSFDPGGAAAAAGQQVVELREALDRLEYYRQAPPKSLGWEWIEQEMYPLIRRFDAAPDDILHSLCLHIAGQIARAVSKLQTGPQPMLVTGGGRHHTFLMRCIREALAPFEIDIDTKTPMEIVDFKEAIIFAFLGLRLLESKPTSLATVTGATRDVVAGSIHLPPDGGWTLRKA